MEFKYTKDENNQKLSQEHLDIIKKREEEISSLSKIYSNYLLSMTDICFKTCIDSMSNIYSDKERVCVEDCVYNFTKTNEYMVNKLKNNDFYQREHIEDRALEYFSFSEIFVKIFKKVSSKVEV